MTKTGSALRVSSSPKHGPLDWGPDISASILLKIGSRSFAMPTGLLIRLEHPERSGMNRSDDRWHGQRNIFVRERFYIRVTNGFAQDAITITGSALMRLRAAWFAKCAEQYSRR